MCKSTLLVSFLFQNKSMIIVTPGQSYKQSKFILTILNIRVLESWIEKIVRQIFKLIKKKTTSKTIFSTQFAFGLAFYRFLSTEQRTPCRNSAVFYFQNFLHILYFPNLRSKCCISDTIKHSVMNV